MMSMFKSRVETRIVVEYTLYQQTENVAGFREKWCVREGIAGGFSVFFFPMVFKLCFKLENAFPEGNTSA